MTFRPAAAAVAALLLAIRVGPTDAHSRNAAPSGCALLPITLLEQTFGEKFDDPPLETKAPPAYDGAFGSNCQFFSKPPFARGHQTRVDFIVYQEKSAADAKDTFDKVAAYVTDKSKTAPHIGDEAYWAVKSDEESWIHVLKGNTHFAMGMQPNGDAELVSLATAMANKL